MQNVLIESASAFGSGFGGLRLYFGPSSSGGPRLCPGVARSAVAAVFLPVISPRAIAITPLKADGGRYGSVKFCRRVDRGSVGVITRRRAEISSAFERRFHRDST